MSKLPFKKDQPLRTANGGKLNVTWLNAPTQKAQRVLHCYNAYPHRDSIYKAYGRPSSTKVSTFFEIKKEMSDVGGYDIRITGAGSDVYSCAYRVKDGAGYEFMVYHTPGNRFAILIGEPD